MNRERELEHMSILLFLPLALLKIFINKLSIFLLMFFFLCFFFCRFCLLKLSFYYSAPLLASFSCLFLSSFLDARESEVIDGLTEQC